MSFLDNGHGTNVFEALHTKYNTPASADVTGLRPGADGSVPSPNIASHTQARARMGSLPEKYPVQTNPRPFGAASQFTGTDVVSLRPPTPASRNLVGVNASSTPVQDGGQALQVQEGLVVLKQTSSSMPY